MGDLATDLQGARIGVLAGGDPHPHLVWPVIDRIHAALTTKGYDAVVIDLEADGFVDGLANVDVAFIAHWGRVGDTGRVQGMLDLLGLPYTCSGAIATGVAKDKLKSKKLLRFEGLPTPDFFEVEADADPERQAEAMIAELGLPIVAKPIYEGGSYGIQLCRDAADVAKAFADPSFGPKFGERFMSGRGFTVAILEDATDMTVLPAHEIVFIDGRPFLGPVELFTPGMSWSAVPSDEDAELVTELEGLARRAHEVIGAFGLSRTDFKLDAAGRPQILELNPLPAMTTMSDLPFSAERAGIPFDDLVERILRTAVDRPDRAR